MKERLTWTRTFLSGVEGRPLRGADDMRGGTLGPISGVDIILGAWGTDGRLGLCLSFPEEGSCAAE